ncbi:MAG: hypothetical protein H6631_17835 [Anaerolineaceae bacterium]|nr:hypothetical protein [Anaerolineaceae bacterium]
MFKIPTSPVIRLRLIVVASGLIYLFIFTLPFPLTQYYQTSPPVDYTKLTHYSLIGLLAYLAGLGLLFSLFIGAIRLAINHRSARPHLPSFRFVVGAGAVLAAILLFSYPLTAIDLFIYALRSRGWALYGFPPLSTPPEALPTADRWLGLAGEWSDAASPYGPLWEVISLGAFYLSGGSFLAHLFLLKLIGLLAYLGCTGLIYHTLKLNRPEWAIAGATAFAWNPLVLFESVQNAHNDILMMFFFLAAVWVLAVSRQPSAIDGPRSPVSRQPSAVGHHLLFCLLLAASVLVKFATIIVIPFFLIDVAMRQRRWLDRFLVLIGSGLTLSVLIIGPMALVWPGWDTWAVQQAGSEAGRSLLALLILGLRDRLGTNPAFDLSRALIYFIFGLIYLHQLWGLIALFVTQPLNQPSPYPSDHSPISSTPYLPISPSPIPPLSAAFYTLFWYVLLAAPVFHAWYLLWFLPLASLLLPRPRPLVASIMFSITALTIIPYFETIRVWYPFLLSNHFAGHLIGVPLLILPPALTLLWPTGLTTDSKVSSG